VSDDGMSYPADAGATTFLLTVRGKTKASTLEDVRAIHNSTAGAPESSAGARSLGDLSHNVYSGGNDVFDGELLFLDLWNSLSGLGQFFANPNVEAAAGELFTSRDASVWAPTEGFGDFHLAIPSGRSPSGIGLLRTAVTSIEKAASAFSAYSASTVNQARAHGVVAHSTWTRVPNPGEQPSDEIIGVDVWLDADEMNRYYELGVGFDHLGPVFAGQPDTSTWRCAPGDWVEW
jgi:hypothetical protein